MARDHGARLHVQNHPFATSRAVVALMLREMSTTYGRSPGGYIWAVLEPAAGIALLTIIFSIGFRSPPLGTEFAYFYATGMLPFLMFLDLSLKLGTTIQYSRALLAYPRVTFVDALIARLLMNAMTQFMVHFVVMAFIIFWQSTDVSLDFSKILLSYAMVICLAAGVGTMNSFLIMFFPIWQTVWAVMTRPLFLISCIFFLFETIPRPYSDYLWYNPLVHAVAVMRDGYYPFYKPDYVSFIYTFGLGAVLTLFGLILLHRFHRDILDK